MPAKWFKCPDGGLVGIQDCLKNRGCRMGKTRCATRPYLRLISEERPFNGKVTPSGAGNGPLYMYLMGTRDYAIDPNGMVFAVLGTTTHAKLSVHKYTFDVIAEEPLSDDRMKGIPDVLDEDEWADDKYVLSDYKTWGSYKCAKALGLEKVEEKILGEDGKPVYLKSGKNKGKPKTRKVIIHNPEIIDLRDEEYQLNRYRIFFEQYGFPVSSINIQATPRDGSTYIATGRGIEKNLYIIPIKRLPDSEVLDFYSNLQAELSEAIATREMRLCNEHECWEGRRCADYCAVAHICETEYDRPAWWEGKFIGREAA